MPSPQAITAFLKRSDTSSEVAATLEAVWKAAQQRWPTVRVSPERFFETLGLRARHDVGVLEKLRTADLYLAVACLEGDPGALHQLDVAVLPRARTVIERVGDSDFQAEVLQLSRQKLLMTEDGAPPKLEGYQGLSSLVTWLRTVLYRTAMSLKRGGPQQAPEELLELMPDPAWSAELQFVKRVHRREFARAFTEALAALDDTERSVLRLNLVEKLNIDRIGVIYGTHRATIARWIARARTKLTEDIERRLRERLQLTTPEFEGLLESLQHNLGVSLERLLDEDG